MTGNGGDAFFAGGALTGRRALTASGGFGRATGGGFGKTAGLAGADAGLAGAGQQNTNLPPLASARARRRIVAVRDDGAEWSSG